MDASGPEPEQLEREFPGWVVWTTVRRVWYAQPVRPPKETLSADSGDGMRLEIQEWLKRDRGPS